MTTFWLQAAQILAYVGMVVGFIGTMMPVIPGPILIWLSALLWAWADQFERLGWPALAFMGLLALAGEGADLLFAGLGARRGGASWGGMIVASLLALLGFAFFNIPGALAGSVGGLLVWEARRHDGDWRKAWRAGKGMFIGYVLSALAQIAMAVLMLAFFVWQVWR